MATPLATPATTEILDPLFGPWYRRSPFFEKTLEAGCSAYDIYNHMYLPGYYADPVEEYWALLDGVTLWDVSVERIVEITGPDSSAFINTLTCRDLTMCAVGQGKYVPITAEDGGIVNDPVLLRVEEERWWLALADSDAGLWARGVAVHSGMDVTVREPGSTRSRSRGRSRRTRWPRCSAPTSSTSVLLDARPRSTASRS